MKIEIIKPNKSSPYWRLFIGHPLGFDAGIEKKMGKYVAIHLTKKQLEQLKKRFLNEKYIG